MKVFPISVRLLAPMFNYCKATNDGAITSDFIGDIALTYALNRVRKDKNFYQEFRQKPNYFELRKLDYFFSVAKPVKTQLTGLYVRNTLFNVDGGPDFDILGQSGRFATGKNLFKNFFKVQGVALESIFSACLFCKDTLKPRFPLAVRIGTGRECLALLEQDHEFDENKNDLWLNAFSLKTIFGDEAIKLAVKMLQSYHFDYKLENYILLKKVQLEQAKTIFSVYF